MMWPLPCLRRRGRTSRVTCTTPQKLVSIWPLNSFSTDPSISSDDLRRQSKPAKKGLAHSPWIKEAGLTRDQISGVAALFHHQSGGFKTKTLHCFGRGLACFGAKGTAKLPGTEMYRFGQLLNG